MDKIERDSNNQPTDEAKNHKIFAIEEKFQNLGFIQGYFTVMCSAWIIQTYTDTHTVFQFWRTWSRQYINQGSCRPQISPPPPPPPHNMIL
jgi:hypothetical protein